jgi:tRNA U34 5-carboxymethylaminomethyl modifying enzyme MnmG/GidA
LAVRYQLRTNKSLKEAEKRYEVVVVGAGVAGCHAALASAEIGAQTLLITSSWDSAAALAWGPQLSRAGEEAIGRLGGFPSRSLVKSTVCRIDDGGTEGRFLDGREYQRQWKLKLEDQGRLTVFQDTCDEIDPVEGGWLLSTSWGMSLAAKAVVVAVGTFLGGRVEFGAARSPGGRPGQTGSTRLEGPLSAVGLEFVGATRSAPPIVWAGKVGREELAPVGVASSGASGGQAYRAPSTEGGQLIMAPTARRGRLFYLLGPASLDAETAMARQAADSLPGTEVVSEGFTVHFLRLAQSRSPAAAELPAGLLFAGQIAGSTNYGESAAQGWLAGTNAADGVSRET